MSAGVALEAVSAFAGIGGFDVGFGRAGITTTHQIEWDRHCQTILRRQFPHTILMGDIHDVRGTEIGRPEIVSGGFPCQDTAIAAPHRLGLAGKRSGHFFPFVRLLDEHLRLVDATRPRWVVIENPDGLLASPGRDRKTGVDRTGWDMAAVTRGLEDLGYGWAFRVVDGRHLGTVQRRKRVIVVGHRGGDPRPAWQVLGDAGDRGQADPSRRERGRTVGPAPAGGPAFDAVWRKSARARAALSKGGYETWVADGNANTLTGFDGGGAARQTHLIAQHGRLRTLTLTEWERLQGFPDGWTTGVPDSARYTAIGNAMHVGMAEWLGRRLVQVHQNLNLIGAA